MAREIVNSISSSGGGSTNYYINPSAEADVTTGVTITVGATVTPETTSPIKGDQSFLITQDNSGSPADVRFEIDGLDNFVIDAGIAVSSQVWIQTDASDADGDVTFGLWNETDGEWLHGPESLPGGGQLTRVQSLANAALVGGKTYQGRLLRTDSTNGRAIILDELQVSGDASGVSSAIYDPVMKQGSGSQTTDAEMTEFTYNDLVVGATYKIEYTFAALINDGGADHNITVTPKDGTTDILNAAVTFDHPTDYARMYATKQIIHTMTSNKLSFHTSSASSIAKIEKGQSAIIVTRLPNSITPLSGSVVNANAKGRWTLASDISHNEGAVNAVPWNTEAYNIGGFTNTSGKITIPANGYYKITTQWDWNNTSVGGPVIYIVKDSVIMRSAAIPISTADNCDIAEMTLECEKGEQIWVAHSSSNASETIKGGAARSYLEITRLAEYSAGQPAGFGLATATEYGLVKKAGGVVWTEAKQDLSSTGPYTSTAYTEFSSALRIEATPSSSNSYYVVTVSLKGFVAASADMQVSLFYGVGAGSTPNVSWEPSVGYFAHRGDSAQLKAGTAQFIIPNSEIWSGTRVISPFYKSSNGSAVTAANSAANGWSVKIEEIVP
jgi:hypothetical protein